MVLMGGTPMLRCPYGHATSRGRTALRALVLVFCRSLRYHENSVVHIEFSWYSMHSALEELKLAHLWVVYPGKESYSLAKNVRVIPLTELAQIEA